MCFAYFSHFPLDIGSLLCTFYVPTGIFAIVSMISFVIKPSMVPGRMGMIVTILLISSNVYTNIDAPLLRGFSYTEVWILGSQLPILFSIFEYAIILAFTKHHEGKNYFGILDMASFCLSFVFYLIFNAFYWSNVFYWSSF